MLFTSGQHLAPMADELPYAVSKGAIHQMTRSLADHLADRRHHGQLREPRSDRHRVGARRCSPNGGARRCRSGGGAHPTDVANLVAFLVSDDGAWITGQVIDSEGGFRRGVNVDNGRDRP